MGLTFDSISRGRRAGSTPPRIENRDIAITPIAQKAITSRYDAVGPKLVAIAGNMRVPKIAPTRPIATDVPTPIPRKWVGNSSVNVGYAEVHAAVPAPLAITKA